MYQTLLFDLDGTLTDPGEGITRCVQYALASFGIQEPCSNLYAFIGPPLLDTFMERYGFSREQAAQAVVKYRERFAPIGIFENRVYEGILPLLQELDAQGRRLCVATSKPTEFALRILEKYELAPYFDLVVGSEMNETRTHKDEVIEEVLRLLDLSPAEKAQTVMIGDRSYDIRGAQKWGLDSIGVGFGYAEPGELESAGATHIAKTVADLRSLLLA